MLPAPPPRLLTTPILHLESLGVLDAFAILCLMDGDTESAWRHSTSPSAASRDTGRLAAGNDLRRSDCRKDSAIVCWNGTEPAQAISATTAWTRVRSHGTDVTRRAGNLRLVEGPSLQIT